MPKRIQYAICLPLFVIIGLFFILPTTGMLVASFVPDGGHQVSLANYIEVITKPYYQQAFMGSLLISVGSATTGLVIALVIAQAILDLKPSYQDKISYVINLASNFAGVPLAFAFVLLLGNAGVLKILLGHYLPLDIYSWQGLVLTYTYFQIPLGIIFVYPLLKTVKKEWYEATSLLGASSWYATRHVVLPHLLPSLIGIFMILFANSMSTYETAYALVGGTGKLLTMRIAGLVSGDINARPNLASSLAVLFALLMSLMMLVSQKLITGRKAA